MKCRSCGTEIAEKALICYKCGGATTEAKFQPPAARPASAGTGLSVSVLLLVISVLVAQYLNRIDAGEVPEFVAWAAAGMALVLAVWRLSVRRKS